MERQSAPKHENYSRVEQRMPSDSDHRNWPSGRTSLALVAFLACFAVFLRCRTSAKQLDDATEKLAGVDPILEAQRREQHLPGLAFAIVKDDRVIYTRVLGRRDVE